MSQSPDRYIYIDANHMSSPAIPPQRGLFGWLRRSPSQPIGDTKIQAFVQSLEQAGEIGTLTDPKRYFRGRLPMRWGSLLTTNTDDPQLTYFGGYTDEAIIGLVGKTGAIHSTPGAATVLATSAWMPYLFALLKPELSLDLANNHNGLIRPDDPQDRQKAAKAVQMATIQDQRKDLPQEVEICARTLLVGAANPWQEYPRIIAGIPLYVAFPAPVAAVAV